MKEAKIWAWLNMLSKIGINIKNGVKKEMILN